MKPEDNELFLKELATLSPNELKDEDVLFDLFLRIGVPVKSIYTYQVFVENYTPKQGASWVDEANETIVDTSILVENSVDVSESSPDLLPNELFIDSESFSIKEPNPDPCVNATSLRKHEIELLEKSIYHLLFYGAGFTDERISEKILFDFRHHEKLSEKLKSVDLVDITKDYRIRMGIPNMIEDSEAFREWREDEKNKKNRLQVEKANKLSKDEMKIIAIKRIFPWGELEAQIIEHIVEGERSKAVGLLKSALIDSGRTFEYGSIQCFGPKIKISVYGVNVFEMTFSEAIDIYWDHIVRLEGGYCEHSLQGLKFIDLQSERIVDIISYKDMKCFIDEYYNVLDPLDIDFNSFIKERYPNLVYYEDSQLMLILEKYRDLCGDKGTFE